jgi:hypothetical protein
MPDLLDNPVAFKDIEYQFATSGVYAIYCTHTDTYYIGQATVVLRRLVDHFTKLREGRHGNDTLQTEFDRCDEDEFIVDLIVDMPGATIVELKVQETKEIQRFKTHGKRLYNKVDTSIRLNKPKKSPRTKKKSEPSGGGVRRASHVEKVREQKQEPGTCYDCGEVGILTESIFECDDNHSRCQGCIEEYLDQWLVNDVPKGQVRASLGRASGDVYRRWRMPRGAHIKEHILLAARNYSKKFGYMPVRVYVNEEMSPPRYYKGIEVIIGENTPAGFIDILIE